MNFGLTEKQMNSIADFLCAVAGVRQDALEKAQGARAQSVTLGLLLLLTPSLSGITMGYAIVRTFGDSYAGWPASIGGGLLWTGIVFGIERALVLGMDKAKGLKGVLVQIAIRIPLAIMLGITVSKPLLLRISRSVLDHKLYETKLESVEAESRRNARLEELDLRRHTVDILENDARALDAALQGEPTSQDYQDAKREAEAAADRYERVLRRNRPLIANLQAQLQQATARAAAGNPESRQDSEMRQQILGQYQREISRAASDQATAKKRQEDARADWRRQEEARRNDLGQQVTRARAERAIAVVHTNDRNGQTEMELGRDMSPNLINEYTTLKRIQYDSSNPDAASLRHFEWALDLFFIILELTPISIKALSRITPLDHAVTAAEAEDEERILNAANLAIARIQKSTEAAFIVESNALDLWRDGHCARLELQGTVTADDLEKLREETKLISV